MSALVQMPVRVTAEPVRENDWQQILELINRHTLEPVEDESQIFTFSGVCSNDRIDAYMTRMDPLTTLRNYVEDLQNGVSLQAGHDISKNPYGRSYDAQFIASQEENSVRGFWYILRDLNINGENTNDTIRAIKGGIMRDLSVGFGGDQMYYRCSSCGKDLFDWECTHFPGLEDENGRMVTAWIVNGRLREVSTVYKGATPGAFADKARSFVQQKQLSDKNIMKLENAYSIRLDDNKGSFYMPSKKAENQITVPSQRQEEDKNMGEENNKNYFSRNNLIADIRHAVRENKIEKSVIYDILAEEGDVFRQPEDIAIRNELGKDLCKPEAIKQMKKEAQQGRQYLADTIDEAVAARTRAFGDTFNAESYRSMLARSGEIDSIKEEIQAYERAAKERFKPGRQTEPAKLSADDDSQDDNKRFEPIEDENLFDGGDE
ncbi:hypothetical protein ACWA2C_28010 [Priestia megaterium]